MERLIKSNLLKADLIEIDKQFQSGGIKDMTRIILLKHSFLTISNVVDFENTIRTVYRHHRGLSEIYKNSEDEYLFVKYLRNKFIGHIQNELLTKAIEWKPEIRYIFDKVDNPDVMYVLNLWVLETAINTYVKEDEARTHYIFESETDLMYPPDMERFLLFLAKVIKSAIDYLDALGVALSSDLAIQDNTEVNLDYWMVAGKTEFQRIKK
ncbi:hypothetical protein JE299_000423 [Salmonella enterica]|nr:hypothetical protein [Salmonella enterica]